MAKVSIKRPDFIVLSRLRQFRIETIALDPASRGMRLHLRGVAGQLWTRFTPLSKRSPSDAV
jgi:hypothetical protein